MTTQQSRQRAYEYADQLCRHLAGELQQEREARGLSRYALAKNSGVSSVMIGRIEKGLSIPTFFVGAQLAFGLGIPLHRWVVESEPRC